MVNLGAELQLDTFFQGGLLPQVFTFYNSAQEHSTCVFPLPLTPGPQNCSPPDNSDHDVAQSWIDNVAKPGPDDLIVIIGHSYGGNRARLFAAQLGTDGHPIAAVITVDPIDWMLCHLSPAPLCDESTISVESKPDNVSNILSFTQDMTNLVDLAGYHLWTDTTEPPFVLLPYGFQQLSYSACTLPIFFCAHRFIAWDPAVHSQIQLFVQQLLTSPPLAISNVTTSGITANSLQVSWSTLQNTTANQVLFATDSSLSSFYIAGNDMNGVSTQHVTNISGLAPGQVYYYRVTSTPIGQTAPLYSSVKTVVTLASGSASVNAAILLFDDVTDPNNPAVSLQLKNTGTATATGCQITKATIGSTVASMPLPLSVADVVPGGTVVENVLFPGPIGPSGSVVSVLISGDCSGKSFAAALRARL